MSSSAVHMYNHRLAMVTLTFHTAETIVGFSFRTLKSYLYITNTLVVGICCIPARLSITFALDNIIENVVIEINQN